MNNSDSQQYDVILEAREDRCPMPLLKTKLALSKMTAGQVLRVEAGDAGSLKDIPQYVTMSNLTLVSQTEDNNVYIFTILKN
ncbi:sulfurtransferase TusA family protein [Marinomonas dokdonensis]|uniref:sulfurtransferase TusA family protein n=1 Tax=Marinomonas dokdonensis TaxID=328224 RepID=UPI004055749F